MAQIADDLFWYRDAVAYSIDVGSFFDSDQNSAGNFRGVSLKLEYLRDLGVTLLVMRGVLPSFSPLGNPDITNYRAIDSRLGTLSSFKNAIAKAKTHGIRVVIALQINNTSTKHRWFERARRSGKHSKYRKFYIWRCAEDMEEDFGEHFRKWSWDVQAKAYYHQSFGFHCPDLNYNSPLVVEEILEAIRFWLRAGAQGVILEGLPHIVTENAGSVGRSESIRCILTQLRRGIDVSHPGRILIAPAIDYPEEAPDYVAEGGGCHMAINRFSAPKFYLALAQEDRQPVADIMRQTPEIPENCQWAIFLRNHDELALEMVTDQERDDLLNCYAVDRRARLNLGIRRRLAPLMENDRAKIELINSLLLSMLGTPIIYCGDEIGMGENLSLGDRDGLRTPMQWSAKPNGGFSKADPDRLYPPVNIDPIYGFGSVNVEAQQCSPSSLLNWMRRMIAVRRKHPAFGRGALNFLYPGNRKILAYLRMFKRETILCVVNLSRTPQDVELDLSRFRGRVPIELLGSSLFPPIGDLAYLLTLGGYGFYWFLLADEETLEDWYQPGPEPLPEFLTLVMRDGMRSIAEGPEAVALFRDVYPGYLPMQRWFAAKCVGIAEVKRANAAVFETRHGDYLLVEADVTTKTGDRQRYFVPLASSPDEQALSPSSPLFPYTVARGRKGRVTGPIYDALADDRFILSLIEAMREGREIPASSGVIRFSATHTLREMDLPPDVFTRRIAAEQSNSSFIVGEKGVLKVYRRLSRGIHPEIEVSRFLTEVAGFRNTPAYLGAINHVPEKGEASALGLMQRFLYNQGDGWTYTVDYLVSFLEGLCWEGEELEDLPFEELHGVYLAQAATLGLRTGQLHRALAIDTDDPAFAREPLTREDLHHLRDAIREEAMRVFDALAKAGANAEEADKDEIDAVAARREECLTLVDRLIHGLPDCAKTRVHGDYHLGQVLVVKDDFHILDFEGEPARSLEERRAKSSPAKDVAGMLRSFDYAAWTATMRLGELEKESAARALPGAMAWRDGTCTAFLDAYRAEMEGVPSWPADEDEAQRLLYLFLLEKVLYEIRYEAANRPGWLRIPVRGLASILNDAA